MPVAPGHPKDWSQRVFNYLKAFPPKDNLETFKKNLKRMNEMSPNKHYEIREIKPPHDGIAYACTYDIHTMVSKPPMKSSFANIEQFWDVDGNCIGFSFQGQQFMFPAKNTDNRIERLLPQNMRDAGIKSANFKSASDTVATKGKTATRSRLKNIERE